MKKLIFLIPLLFSGCLYINRDIGLTTYQYDKCVEYYDENGTYHKDCPESAVKKGSDIAKKVTHTVVETTKDLTARVGEAVLPAKRKKCFCKKSCVQKCLQNYSKQICIKKCCYEK